MTRKVKVAESESIEIIIRVLERRRKKTYFELKH